MVRSLVAFFGLLGCLAMLVGTLTHFSQPLPNDISSMYGVGDHPHSGENLPDGHDCLKAHGCHSGDIAALLLQPPLVPATGAATRIISVLAPQNRTILLKLPTPPPRTLV